MKRRNLILSFVVIALLLIGIGYAALSETLTITSTVASVEPEINLEFTSGSAKFNNEDVADVVDITNSKAATITYEQFAVTGDKLVAELTITNNSTKDMKANLSYVPAELEEEDGYFTVAYEVSADVVAANGGEVVVTVTITLTKTSLTVQDAEFVFNIKGEIVEA